MTGVSRVQITLMLTLKNITHFADNISAMLAPTEDDKFIVREDALQIVIVIH